MKLNLNFKKIAGILLVSILLAFSYNYFSPKGIPLIAEEKKLSWADDSLLFSENNIVKKDTLHLAENNKNIEEKTSEVPQRKYSVQNDFVELPPDVYEDSIEENSDKNVDEKNIPENEKQNNVEPESTEPKAINLEQAVKLYEAGILFIDAREPEDYKNAHIKNSINLPMDHFDEYKSILDTLDKNQPIVTYCAGTDCDLSIVLGNVLFDSGFKRIFVFFGGWNEWVEAGLPTESLVQ